VTEETAQPKSVEVADNKPQSHCDDHLMPGLVPQLVNTFLTPRKHLTTRGVARRKKVAETFVTTALFREVFREIREIRGLVGRKPVQSEITVREFKARNVA
jgi:hypothetical protein